MGQDILYTLKRRQRKGFAALTVVLLSAVLGVISFAVI